MIGPHVLLASALIAVVCACPASDDQRAAVKVTARAEQLCHQFHLGHQRLPRDNDGLVFLPLDARANVDLDYDLIAFYGNLVPCERGSVVQVWSKRS